MRPVLERRIISRPSLRTGSCLCIKALSQIISQFKSCIREAFVGGGDIGDSQTAVLGGPWRR